MSTVKITDMTMLMDSQGIPTAQFEEWFESTVTRINLSFSKGGKRIALYAFDEKWKRQPTLLPFITYLENSPIDLEDPANNDLTVWHLANSPAIKKEMLREVNLKKYLKGEKIDKYEILNANPMLWPKDKKHFKMAEIGFLWRVMGIFNLEEVNYRPKILYGENGELAGVGYFVLRQKED